MSKRDIETVCQLSAHLALRSTWEKMGDVNTRAPKCAADAMRLQRLGRSTLNAVRRYSGKGSGNRYQAEKCFGHIGGQCVSILAPYGLKHHFQDDAVGPALYIDGLPDNTEFTGEGFGI